MRKRIFEIIEVGYDNDKLGQFYDWFMMTAIVISIVPLMFKYQTSLFYTIDKVTVIIFIIDYLLRLGTADYKLQKGYASFAKYPFQFMALVDLISILPSLTVLGQGFKLFKIFRLLRTLKVLRVFKAFRYSKSTGIIINVFHKQKDALLVVSGFAIAYIFITALIIFNVEPNTFDTFFNALYWATVSLTTMGYGDIYATSTAGQVITMISSILGIAIVALPAGILTAGYMEEIKKPNT